MLALSIIINTMASGEVWLVRKGRRRYSGELFEQVWALEEVGGEAGEGSTGLSVRIVRQRLKEGD